MVFLCIFSDWWFQKMEGMTTARLKYIHNWFMFQMASQFCPTFNGTIWDHVGSAAHLSTRSPEVEVGHRRICSLDDLRPTGRTVRSLKGKRGNWKKTPRNMERYGNIMGISREYNQDIWEMELLVCWKKNIEVLLLFQANGRYPFLSEYLRGSANLVSG